MAEKFFLRKMKHQGIPRLEYFLDQVSISGAVGREISLHFTGKIECIECGRGIKKSFQQGYCYPCFQTLAACDPCIMRPHTCHFHKGTCREPEWGQENCMREHVVYLANTTGLKVGITKAHSTLVRWGDQGATAALILARVPDRLTAGLIEIELAKHISDKSNWRNLLKGQEEQIDLIAERERIIEFIPDQFQKYLVLDDLELTRLEYPVDSYLQKAKTHDFDKQPTVSGRLQGIRGQYLLIGDAGLNVRKFAGYQVELNIT